MQHILAITTIALSVVYAQECSVSSVVMTPAPLDPVIPPPIGPAVNLGGGGTGFGTHFDAVGSPYGGCGVPGEWLVDDTGKAIPFVALNTQYSSVSSPMSLEPVPANELGMFNNGLNCGRWITMTLGKTCLGGSNTANEVCIINGTSGLANYVNDDISASGTVVYGYVSDKCSDDNAWCRPDKFHVDIATAAVDVYVSANKWGNRLVTWQFMSGPPAGYKLDEPLRFGWAAGSYLPYYMSLIMYNTKNGISRVDASAGAGQPPVPARPNDILGQQWILPWSTLAVNGTVSVTVYDVAGASYGTWSVEFPCSGKCSAPTLASASLDF